MTTADRPLTEPPAPAQPLGPGWRFHVTLENVGFGSFKSIDFALACIRLTGETITTRDDRRTYAEGELLHAGRWRCWSVVACRDIGDDEQPAPLLREVKQ